MDRNTGWSFADQTASKQKRSSCGGCLRLTPWSAFLTAALFLGGLACFVAGGIKVWEYTKQVAQAVGIAPDLTNSVRSGLLTAVLVVGICGVGIIVLVLLLGLWRVAQKSSMGGGCCCDCGNPSPGAFTAYRASGGLLNFLVWLLLLAVVAMLMVMLLWLGGAVAINAAITRGRSAADSVGIKLNTASDVSAAIQNFLGPLTSNNAIQQLLGGQTAGTYAFAPICPPFCLNLGSFAIFLQADSCICGSGSLNAVDTAAREGTRVGIIALVGAGAMYIATTALLMILTAHYTEAKFDRTAARKMKQQKAEDYENGFAADPRDCVVQQPSVPEPVNVLTPPQQHVGNSGGNSVLPWQVAGAQQHQLEQVAQRYQNHQHQTYPGVML